MTLANRLCSFFLAAVAVLLAGSSAVLDLLISSHLDLDLDERLAGVLDQVVVEMLEDSGRIAWEAGRWRPVQDRGPSGRPVEWAVFDPAGRPLEQSPGFPRGEDARVLELVPDSGHRHATVEGPGGGRWRLTLRRARASAPVAPPPRTIDDDESEDDEGKTRAGAADPGGLWLALATAQELGPLESSMSRVSLLLAGSSTAIWLLAAVAGRRALRPMVRMSDVARAMSAADRGRKLPSPGTHDELETLAGAFNGLLDRLREALDRQDRFAGDASHQLRTPLTALIGEVEVARRRDRSAEDYRQILDDVHGEAIRLQLIIESLLFLARAEAEAGRPGLQPVDLASWVPGHLRGWSADDRAGDFRVEVEPGPTPRALVHPPLLCQLLDNLLENAAKYSEPGTPIVVRIGRGGDSATLAFEDRGCGLDPEDLPHLFEPFYRSERARRMGRPGVGLGLSVVQRIAGVFGGTVRAEGEPGRGSQFIVRLPAPAAGPR